jgi:hypothetical protein
MFIKSSSALRLLAAALVAIVAAGCDNDSDGNGNGGGGVVMPPPATASFDVTITNLTNAQPLSPVAVIAHQDGYAVFAVGSAATVGLETLAEGGDNSALIAEATAAATVMSTASGAAPIGPAGSETISITVLESELPGLGISVSSMLVNTNDAITGLNAAAVGDMAPGDSASWRIIAYDSGTEANSEEAAHIPGPAGGGEGFNAARDDRADRVAMHSGIVGQDDGFATSSLDNQHRFDNPVAAVRIERIN